MNNTINHEKNNENGGKMQLYIRFIQKVLKTVMEMESVI